MHIGENDQIKILVSDGYNYSFDKKTGKFQRWGHTFEDDPTYSPEGPEILDIEVTTICNNGCPFCYKSNTKNGKNMSFETFKTILDKMPRTLTQCAFGADSSCTSNPDIWKMMEYCRENTRNPIVPNITVANISDTTADKLVRHCGAVAVSRYSDKNICYDSVHRLTSRGLAQTNIHIMVSEETYDQVVETLNDRLSDPRLKDLKAIVLLSLKKKGRGTGFTPLSQDKFNRIVKFALKNNIQIGFDSCSAGKFLDAVRNHPLEKVFEIMTEPCEAFGIFSSYISVDGEFYPCSFCEQAHDDFQVGLDVVNCNDFIKDIWNNPIIDKWRQHLLQKREHGDYSCPIYEV